jgi:ribosome-associated protein
MSQESFQLQSEFIPLIGLLKALGWASTGGEAGMMVQEGFVQVNGELELRKRRKLKSGDRVECSGNTVLLER